jgi:hypothetical protein
MTDRDHFAAAALTALLASGEDCVDPYMASMCERAYEWADAMLRERERTNLDPEPAGKAAEPESSVPLGSVCGTGNTQKPVAWRAYASDGSEAVYSLYEQARAAADEWKWSVEPLYRSATLTDEEREAIALARMYLNEAVRLGLKKQRAYTQDGDPDGAVSIEKGIAGLESARETLSKLLERLT